MFREHAKAFASLDGVKLAGVHSRTRARAEAGAKEFGIPLVADSVEELYEKTKADLVVIAVPELALEAVAMKAFKFGWTCLLEKPAGFNLPLAEKIAAAAKGKPVYVALNRRFNSSTKTVLADLAKESGQRFINCYDQQSVTDALAIGHPREVAENFMYANSIHAIDLIRVFGRGKIKSVRPVIEYDPAKPGVVVARIEFESGDLALYQGIWNGPGPWALTVTTPVSRWELRPLEKAAVQRKGERILTPVEQAQADKDFKAGFRLQAEQTVAAVRGEPNEAPTIQDSLESMRLVAAIFGHAKIGA
jgi:predicted dehydrogenase